MDISKDQTIMSKSLNINKGGGWFYELIRLIDGFG